MVNKIHEIFGIKIHPDSNKPGKCGTVDPNKWGVPKNIFCNCDLQSKTGGLQWICEAHCNQPEQYISTLN